MDFGSIPPEITSAKMYSGPGNGALLAAAAAWQQIAGDIDSAAGGWRSVLATLSTDVWRGPASMLMANAAAPHIAWMYGTAAQAEQTALAAKAAAAAHQTALAATVPPTVVAENRTERLALIATNVFGQNSPAIAANEAAYDAMWAQDAVAMYGYHAAALTASKLTPFAAAPNPVAQPAAAPVTAAQAAAVPTQAIPLTSLLNTALAIPALLSATASTSSSSFSGAAIFTTNHALAVNAQRDMYQGIGPFWIGSKTPSVPPAPIAGPGASALVGRASLVGTLSVPQAWSATTTPATATATLPAGATTPTAPITAQPVQPGMFGEAMLGTLAGRGVNNAAAKLRRPSLIPKSPAAG